MKGGGGGGGSNKKKDEPKVPEDVNISGYAGIPQYRELDPFMANNQQLLAQQLAAGYGAPQQQYIDRMNEVYSPIRSIQMNEPLTATKNALDNDKYNWGSTGLLSLDRVLGIPDLTKDQYEAKGLLGDWEMKYGGSSGKKKKDYDKDD